MRDALGWQGDRDRARFEVQRFRPRGPLVGLDDEDLVKVALLTDGRFSGATHGFMAGHVAPEAFRGGPIAAVQDGDRVTIDVDQRRIDVGLNDQQNAARVADNDELRIHIRR